MQTITSKAAIAYTLRKATNQTYPEPYLRPSVRGEGYEDWWLGCQIEGVAARLHYTLTSAQGAVARKARDLTTWGNAAATSLALDVPAPRTWCHGDALRALVDRSIVEFRGWGPEAGYCYFSGKVLRAADGLPLGAITDKLDASMYCRVMSYGKAAANV